MRLWNDYEGTTIAGDYPIKKLLRPEGRSAFFSTSNGTGTPAVIRLIEAINDEAEILSRWKAVADLKEAHLVSLKKFGQTVFEGTPLIYVLMEDTEADLASILTERTLTVEETREIATSLVEAVGALHASGIIHEHIEPMSVLAKGEVVKLRSDCVREAPEGEEGIALTKQDVHDLCQVLLQSLTRQRSLDAVGRGMLPAPFDQIIRNGMSGTWGLAQIAIALAPAVIEPPVQPAVEAVMMKPQQMPLAIPKAGVAADVPEPAPNSASKSVGETAANKSQPASSGAMYQQSRISVPVEEDAARRRLWMAIAPVVIVIAGALGWHFLHSAGSANPVPTQPITTLADVSQPKQTAPAQPLAAVVPPVATNTDAARRWRVVAYTYNRQDQAQHKVDQVAQREAALRPEVFTPSGGSPYLVTLGGAMTRAEAASLKEKAARAGLPRDIYIQNYKASR